MPELSPVQRALRVAYRNFNALGTTEQEQDAILAAMAEFMPSEEAETAARQAYHRRQEKIHQLKLHALLDGIGARQD